MVLDDASSVVGLMASLVQEPGLISGVILIVASLVVTVLSGRRRILWRDQLNVDVSITPKEAWKIGSPITWRIGKQHGAPLTSPSLALLRIRNGGFSRIDTDDVIEPLTFEFPGRKVEWFELAESSTPALERTVKEKGVIEEDRLMLKRFSLERGQRFSLLILLSRADDKHGSPGPAQRSAGRWSLLKPRDRTWNRGRWGKPLPHGWAIAGSAQIKGGGRSGGMLYERSRRDLATRTLAVIGVIAGLVLAFAGSVIGAAAGSGGG